MTGVPVEQRNPYKGSPARPWIRIRAQGLRGTFHDWELLADTGNPCALIISRASMALVKQRDGLDVNSNFGVLEGGWLHVSVPEVGLDADVLGYSSDLVVTAAQASNCDFEGLVGLPFLRLVEYGGNANAFWVRAAP